MSGYHERIHAEEPGEEDAWGHGYGDQKNCFLLALRWQVTGALLRTVPKCVRETSVSTQTLGAPEKV